MGAKGECGYESVTWGIFMMIEIACNLTILMSKSWLWYCYHWGKLGNGYRESLCIIFHNFVWIYNDLKKFNLKHVYRDTHFPFCLRLQYDSAQHCLARERPSILALLDLPRSGVHSLAEDRTLLGYLGSEHLQPSNSSLTSLNHSFFSGPSPL